MHNDENIIDINSVEPTCLTKIVIAPRIKEVVQTSIDAYFNDKLVGRNPTYGPLGFVGPSGCGKSLVAKAVAASLGLDLKSINGHNLSGPNFYSFFLDANETTTCLLIDEAQGILPKNQERMLTILSEGKIEVPSRHTKKSCQLPIPKCPIILACMSEHSLIPAIRTRLRIYTRFDYYSLEELIAITKQRILALNWNVESDEVIKEICIRAKRTPRLALRNLQLCWNMTRSQDRDEITMEDTRRAFQLSEIDELGLDFLERSYLKIVSEESPIALNVIISRLSGGGIEVNTIKNVIEPYLIMERLITKEGSLRTITDIGRDHLKNTKL